MITEEIKLSVDKLRSEGKMFFQEGTTEQRITIFEKEKGITFPSKYRDWLLFSDGGELYLPAGIQLYGIEHKPFINVENTDRPNDEYLVIGALASGDPILCEKAGEKISIYNHEAGRIESDEIYSDFITFLDDLSDLLGIEG